MKEFKFNEQSAIENMMKIKFVDRNNITNTIYNLAKYYHHVLQYSDEENYACILKYITDNCENIYEENIYKDIEGCIKSAKKHTYTSIDEVRITAGELEVIKRLDNIKHEKIAFVILAVAKYFNALNDIAYDAAFLSNADICKMARVTVPVNERDVLMQFAYDKDILYRHTWADSSIKKPTFISHDENDKIVLRLKEGDFKDLAYTYLAYKTPHLFRRCVSCNCWIKKDSKDRRICKDCFNDDAEEKDVIKEIQCIDCGKTVYVSILNAKTCRCEKCQDRVNAESNRERQRRWYDAHIKPNGNPENLNTTK